MALSVFWFRRDLRLEDNTALFHALSCGYPVLPIFIFDSNILNELEKDDARVSFIHKQLSRINDALTKKGSSLLCLHGDPVEQIMELVTKYEIKEIYANKDYEPYALKRDSRLKSLLSSKAIDLKLYKDQVIFEEDEIVKDNSEPYTVYTPYKNKWLIKFKLNKQALSMDLKFLHKAKFEFPLLTSLGFIRSEIEVKDYDLSELEGYAVSRDFPFMDSGSYLSPHLRFGTVSIRDVIRQLKAGDQIFLSELIWREFFMQILFHFPHVVGQSFKPKYDKIQWRNDETDFEKWCQGRTGYPMVDAGMRELNETGYMHNRVRMVCASFLCKHLLIDWRWGEAYFAKKLLDYELSSNNGNWQWAAGTGCDAAPYFRIFNPITQLKKFDPDLVYTKKWIPELNEASYPEPMVDHKFARERALSSYKTALTDQ